MSLFAERERGFEAKFAYDEERRLLAIARRNRLAALWAAERMNKPAQEREAYARDVVRIGITEPGDAVPARIRADLAASGIELSQAELRERMGALMTAAEQQLRIEDLTTPESMPTEH